MSAVPLLEQAAPDEVAPERNSQPLFDERDRFVGYLVYIDGRPPFLTTPSCTPSEPLNRYGRPNKAHATRLRACDRLLDTVIDGERVWS